MMRRKNYLKIFSLILLSSLLVGCSLFKPKVVIEYIYVDKEIPVLDRPKTITYIPFHIDTVSYKNLKEYLEGNQYRNGKIVFIAMDILDYESLSLNMADLLRYKKQQAALLDYYEEQAVND